MARAGTRAALAHAAQCGELRVVQHGALDLAARSGALGPRYQMRLQRLQLRQLHILRCHAPLEITDLAREVRALEVAHVRGYAAGAPRGAADRLYIALAPQLACHKVRRAAARKPAASGPRGHAALEMFLGHLGRSPKAALVL